ncbi:FAD-binding protein [archaeon]|nr:FAD-binding protein [archaeon]
MSETVYDVIILGGGPAGLTAGIYTARQGLNTLLIEGKKLGGRAWGPHRVENFPGFPEGLTGTELMDRFVEQTKKFGVEFKQETVVGMSDMGDTKFVQTRGGFYQSRAAVITTGIQRKSMNIPGELKFKGSGVAYCAICDGPFYKDQPVAVVGCGKDAVEDALRLADTASKVYAIPGSGGFTEGIEELKELTDHTKIDVLDGVDIESIEGDQVVTHINMKEGPVKRLNVNGVFIILDHVGTSDILRDSGIETDGRGCITVDKNQRTNIEGIFAAGDCVCGGMQIVTAAGDGGKAGLAASRYVRGLKSKK